MTTTFYLLVYDRHEGRLVAEISYDHQAAATEAYDRWEKAFESADAAKQFEVVLMTSDSLASIQNTHGSYFDESADENRVRGMLTGS